MCVRARACMRACVRVLSTEKTFPAQRPALSPYGVHVDTQASDDRKPVSRAQMEATLKRRLQVAATKRADKPRKMTNITSSRPKSRIYIYQNKTKSLPLYPLSDAVLHPVGSQGHQSHPPRTLPIGLQGPTVYFRLLDATSLPFRCDG